MEIKTFFSSLLLWLLSLTQLLPTGCTQFFNRRALEKLPPLIRYAGSNDMRQMKKILDGGGDVNVTDQNGFIALHHCAERGKLEACRLLIVRGSNLEGNHYNGWTPLHAAAYYGHLSIVRLLVESGAKINAYEQTGWTPLIAAREGKNAKVEKYLLEYGAKESLAPEESHVASVGLYNISKILPLLGHGCDLVLSNASEPLPARDLKTFPAQQQIDGRIYMTLEGNVHGQPQYAIASMPFGHPEECRLEYVLTNKEDERVEFQPSEIIGLWKSKEMGEVLVLEEAQLSEDSVRYEILLIRDRKRLAGLDSGFSPTGEHTDDLPPSETYRCTADLFDPRRLVTTCQHPQASDTEKKLLRSEYCWQAEQLIPCPQP